MQRIRELAVQAANATNSASDRASLQAEAAQLASEVTRVASQTQFNGLNLLDGSFLNQSFQVGAVVARSAGDLSARQVYMGGPPAMIDAMVRLLLKSRVKRSQIRFDKFA